MSEVAFLVGQTVSEIRDGNRIVFVPGEPEPSLYADVGECTVIGTAGEPRPLGSLVGLTVTATSTASDVLVLEFNDGSTLRCEPDPNYEAWQVVGGDPQYLVVCSPGGELAVWDKRYTPSREKAEQAVERFFGPGWHVTDVREGGGIGAEPSPED
jgi:hypothetical protein